MAIDKFHQPYRSTITFDPQRVHAAAVYCCDGRFGEQCDDLLQNALALPRYDRLAVPGGAACLASHFPTHREEEGVRAQLRFLIDEHQLQTVVLIAHEDCAFYSRRLRISPLQLESQQREDMKKAIRRVESMSRQVETSAWFARKKSDGSIQFEPVVV